MDTTNTLGIGGIRIFVGNDKPIVFKNLSKFEEVRSKILDYMEKAQGNATTTTTSISAPKNNDVAEQLEKLAKLKESGVLTEEEFAEQKSKILKA